MKKSRFALNSAVIFGAGLCGLPALSSAQTTYLGAGGLGINPAGATPNPNRSNGSGGQFGNNGDIISSVVITEGYEDIQNASTTVPGNAVTAPAIFFQINVYSPATGTPTDITTSAQSGYYTDYDFGLETNSAPDAGLVTTPTTVSQVYGAPFGISTGMNYFIAGFNNKAASPSTTGGNSIYNYSTTSTASGPLNTWNQVAGAGQTAYIATTTIITTTSITYGIPLADLGLAVGNSFTFDAYDTFANGNSTYDDLDNPSFAATGYYPYSNSNANSNNAGAPSPYDSATAGGTLASFTVTAPTLTWNNFPASAGGDGATWAASTNGAAPASTLYNWNNGLFADYYVDGSNVVFNDVNSSVVSGGTNVNAYNVTLNSTVLPGSVVVNNSLGNYTISGTGTIGGAGSLTKSGTGTLTLSTPNTYSGGTTVTAGKLVIGQAGTNATFSGPTLTGANTLTALPTGTLSISGNGIVQLADGVTNQTFITPNAGVGALHPTSNINLTSLSLTGNGTLDIGNNRIIIDYTTGHDPIASIKTWIANGFADGETAGSQPAIISGDIAADDTASGFSYGIGYADGADNAIAGLPSGEIEIMFTLLGDANLDGTVNSEDFTPFSNNLNASGRSWDQGDFNYDGTVNSEDFTPFSHDLNQSASFAASEGGVLLSPLTVSNSLANVPEPASTGLLTMGIVSLLAHRRRKAKA